jgi:hypothetical protein
MSGRTSLNHMTTHPDASNDEVRRSSTDSGSPDESFGQMLWSAAEADWSGEPAEALAVAIEARIVAELPARLSRALGDDEAAQRARVIAWERCRRIAARQRTVERAGQRVSEAVAAAAAETARLVETCGSVDAAADILGIDSREVRRAVASTEKEATTGDR